jgi:propionyl-CoA synthetase
VVRIDDCKPKVLITATAGVEIAKRIPYLPLVEKAIELAQDKVDNIIVYNRKLVDNQHEMFDGLIDYEELVQQSAPADCVSVESTHPLYLLYTSGTTGKPKGIVRDTGGYATALKFSMKYVYGVEPGETYWAASDFGWAVGHSFSVYGPLINRNTTIIFEGKPIMTPDAGTFWRIISEYKVSVMFTAPTAIRAIKKKIRMESWSENTIFHISENNSLQGNDVMSPHWTGLQNILAFRLLTIGGRRNPDGQCWVDDF